MTDKLISSKVQMGLVVQDGLAYALGMSTNANFWMTADNRWSVELRTLRTGTVYEVIDLNRNKVVRVDAMADAVAIIAHAERRKSAGCKSKLIAV